MCNNDVRSSVGILELLVQLKAQLKLSAKCNLLLYHRGHEPNEILLHKRCKQLHK
jgi:hypothetical protein